jgi:hypothetical protein
LNVLDGICVDPASNGADEAATLAPLPLYRALHLPHSPTLFFRSDIN